MPRRKPEPEPPPEIRVRRRRNTGSISVAADGTIRARLPRCIDPKRTAREFPPGHLAEAHAWLDSYLYPQPEPAAPTYTVRQWTGVWWKTYVEAMQPPNTARGYLYALRKLEPLYSVSLPDLRASALQGVVGVLNAKLAPSSVQGIVGVWRRCLAAAIDDELIARNPASRLTLPRLAPSNDRRFITPAEASMLAAAIVNHRFEAAYALLLGCGLRIGEVLGLAWSNVDLHGRRAWITTQWTNSHWRPLPKGRIPRWISLPDTVMAAMIRHRNEQPEGTTLVMQSPYGGKPGRRGKRARGGPTPWSYHTVVSDLATIIEALELPPATPHAYRRGLASAWLDGRVTPAVIAARLGHADPGITLRAYTMPSEAGHELAAEVTDRYLGVGDDSGAETA